MSQQLDAHGEAHDALGTAVSSYGQRVLSEPQILGNLVADLLPDLPRERSLLVAAAEAGIAAEMRQHVEEQRIDPDTAVQLVGRALSERRAIDPAASMWVASEYAQALGYPVRPYAAEPAPPAQPQVIPAAPPTMTSLGGPQLPTMPPPGPQPQSWPPTQAAAQSWPPTQAAGQPQPPGPSWPPAGQAPQGQSWPPAGQAPQGASWPPAQPPGQSWPPAGRSGTSWSGGKRGLVAGATAAGLVVLYLVVAAVTHTVPFAKSHVVASPSPIHSSAHPTPTQPTTQPPSSTRPTGPALAAGVAPLTQLLPSDIDDPATQCTRMSPPFQWAMPGLVQALSCTDPGLSKGQIYAFQVDSYADFETTWRNYNKWWGIDNLTPGSNCPPAAGAGGTVGFHNNFFHSRPGQVLECETVGSGSGSQPAYTWAYPSEDAFLVAQGAAGSSFSSLDSWWTNNSGPLSSPSPSAS